MIRIPYSIMKALRILCALGTGGFAPAPLAMADTAPAPAAGGKVAAEATGLVEHFAGWLHGFFPGIDNRLFPWIACGIILVLVILLRHVVTKIIFHHLKKLAAKTESTLDDKLFPALEGPADTLILVLGIFAALTVLPLSGKVDQLVTNGTRVAVLAVLTWALVKAGAAVLAHFEEIAHAKQLTVATFMPLIKKTLLVVAVVLGLLAIAQSLGWPVMGLLGAAGIGGLAFALAAQDTIANLFGSFVVVMDQPFRVGDVVKIATAEGRVEDIGLRSTKIRTAARTLIVIPNKMVASETITNYTRMPQRRVEQTIGLTYDATPDQVQTIAEDIRQLLRGDPGVQTDSILVHFAEYGDCSLNLHIVYFAVDPDWGRHMDLRERINLKIMRAVAARGLEFAFPTQTVLLDGPVARQLAGGKG
jgi:MscS family membrane protein